ncbi:MAG: anti-anti-sigma factor, partial [Proteobacteria bacterium]
MTESAVRLGEAGELLISGVLDYRTGPDLRTQGQALIKTSTAPSLVLD